jgi:sugar phosphate isomerase/epimerase
MSLSRRSFVSAAASTVAALSAGPLMAAEEKKDKPAKGKKGEAAAPVKVDNEICVFIKPLQSMKYEDLAAGMADLGVQGIEGTIRAKGYIEPAKADVELPKLMEALKAKNLNMTIMTTDVNEANAANEKLLRLAAKLGVKRYRLGPILYDMNQPIWPQVQAIKSKFKELAALNKEIGIQGMYQNHSGGHHFGAPIWDLHETIRELDPQNLGMCFDILHATIEGGLSWPIEFSLMRPYMGAAFFKDFKVTDSDKKKKFDVVPLGEGRVDPVYGKMLMKSNWTGPISLHKEYAMTEDPAKQLNDLKKDLATLKAWLTA